MTAALYYRAALDVKPDSAPLQVQLGRTLLRQTRYEAAIEVLRTAIALDPNEAEARFSLGMAYEFSDKAHMGQKRASGEPYIEHCNEVALILAELHMDTTTLSAALLHDVVEDTEHTLEDIRDKFGD